MPFDKPRLSLGAEVAKLAKLSHVENALPGALRGLPAVAILAGEALSKVTKGRNIVEERLLGADEVVLIAPPRKQSPVVSVERARDGVLMMCEKCRGNRGGYWGHSTITEQQVQVLAVMALKNHTRGGGISTASSSRRAVNNRRYSPQTHQAPG